MYDVSTKLVNFSSFFSIPSPNLPTLKKDKKKRKKGVGKQEKKNESRFYGIVTELMICLIVCVYDGIMKESVTLDKYL